jgi:hypothetical protein
MVFVSASALVSMADMTEPIVIAIRFFMVCPRSSAIVDE